MYARVTYIQAPEGKLEEGLEKWHQNVLPVTKGRPGFRGVVSLIDRESNKSLAITIWDVEKDLLASAEAEYHRQAVERYGEYFGGAKEPENYEVDLAEGPIFDLPDSVEPRPSESPSPA